MAEGEDQEKGDPKKGFAGLSSMVSDVDSTVSQPARESKPAPRAASAPAPAERARSTDDQAPDRPVYQAPAQSSGGSSTGKWLLGIGVVAGLLWLVSQSGDKASSPTPAFTPSSDSSSVASPSPGWQPAPSPTPAPSRPSEERPPVGTNNVLTSAQLRYCVAEKIRLDAAEGAISNYNETHIDRFNEMVADYNGRCGQFRYRSGALEGARAEVERFRGALEADGRARFVRAKAVPTQDLTFVPVEPAPDPTVKAIQERLNELGYDAGPADGLMGGKTRTAIVAFQKESNVPQNGSASAALLQALKQWRPSQRPEATKSSAVVGGRNNELPVAVRPAVTPSPPPSNRLEQRDAQDISGVNLSEQSAIERACDVYRRGSGPSAYNDCLQRELFSLRSSGGRPDLSAATATEQASIERACDVYRRGSGPGSYYDCLRREVSNLRSSGGRPDLSAATATEQASIERACDVYRRGSGPGAYYECLKRELSNLRSSGGRPDLSAANATEQDSIERACDVYRRGSGPGAYYDCLKRELSNLRSSGGRPDLTAANATEQASIERACDVYRRGSGPGAYYECLKRELSNLRSSGGRPDLSAASATEQASIERACDVYRRGSGPGSYYDCLRRELSQLGYRK